MRISADLVLRARAFINPVKDRELDMRGYKIAVIENMGAIQDQFDTLDLSDNEIQKLDNFPRMKRLKTLLLSNNFISRIGPNLGDSLLSLDCLVLTGNKISSLSELDHLSSFTKLTHLSLLDNPVVKQPHYRLYVLNKIPSLRTLDFRKVKLEEKRAAEKFNASAEGKKLQDAVAQEGVALSEQEAAEAARKKEVTEEQKRIAAIMIESAKTPEELDKVERMIRAGIYRLPEKQGQQPKAPAAPPARPAVPPPAPVPAPSAPAPSPAPAPVVEKPPEQRPSPPARDDPPAPVPAPAPAPAEAMEVDNQEEEQEEEEEGDGDAMDDGAEKDGLTMEYIESLRVVDLKAELKKRGLPESGKKAELVDRLKEFVAGSN